MKNLLRSVRLALVAGLALGLTAATASANSPWNGSATGTTKPGTGAAAGKNVDDFGGYSTLLGWFHGTGSHVLNPATGSVVGKASWKAASGDTLEINYTAQVAPSGNPAYPYSFTGTLHAVGGTGKLSHAKGVSTSWRGAFTGVPGSLFFTFDGQLDARNVAPEPNYGIDGLVLFTNIVQGTQPGGIVPYYGVATSDRIGNNTQTGAIKNLTGVIPIDATTFLFLGEVGPHPTLPNHPAIHDISTKKGDIYCTWTAIFTLKIVDATGTAVFSGDGDFKIEGGTGKYHDASGRFRTVFSTGPVPHGADQAVAAVIESGRLKN